MSKKVSIENLIVRFNKKHNYKYDYSLVEYSKMSDKVRIICPHHGEFNQTPSNHLYKGCLKCGLDKLSKIFTKTTEDFIEKSNLKHNNFYLYTKSEYKNWKTNIIVTCIKHGDFSILPNKHLKGNGCKKCKKEITIKNKEELRIEKIKLKEINFIKRSKKIHNNFYTYENVKFINSTTPVQIYCPIHGQFSQKPFHHLRGSGCQVCGIYKKDVLNLQTYIDRCNRKFENKFKYYNYTGIRGHVDVECNIHGINRHLSYNHLKSKYGCKFCSYKIISKSTSGRIKGLLKYSKEELIDILSKFHNYKYDYSLLEYNGMRDKISVFCNKHGEFKVAAYSHLKGSGCKKCSIELKKKTTEKFIKESNIIHNKNYDYSLVNYINSIKKVKIVCSQHGEFNQSPDTHLRGSGCPKCFQFSIGEKIIENFLMNNKIKFESQKTFEDCKNINKLRFDFYIPERNICIEFDGRQHYHPTKIYGGDDGLKNQIYRDNIKNEYCEKNKIEIMRISYRDIKKINKILYDKFCSSPEQKI